jgi:hypothetical protein
LYTRVTLATSRIAESALRRLHSVECDDADQYGLVVDTDWNLLADFQTQVTAGYRQSIRVDALEEAVA